MIDIQLQLPSDKQQTIKDFVQFVVDEIGIETAPKVVIQANRDGLETTAAYSPSDGLVRVNGGGRALVDILRSIAHEVIHHKQNIEGKLESVLKRNGEIADIGGTNEGDDIEDEANAVAGQLIKKFAKLKGSVIYEQKELSPEESEKNSTPPSSADIDKFVKNVCARWVKKGTVNLSELQYMGITHFAKFGTQYHEFLEKIADGILDILTHDLDETYKLDVLFDNVYEMFETVGCGDESSMYFHILNKRNFEMYDHIFSPAWQEYVFESINQENIQLLRRYTNTEDITFHFLEHELPDLCYDICDDYKQAEIRKAKFSSFLYVVNQIKQIFNGCKILMKPNTFVIEIPIKKLLACPTFKYMFAYKVAMLVNQVCSGRGEGCTTTQNIIYSTFNHADYLGTHFRSRMYAELNGGDLPVFNCDHIESSIDKDYFNERVGRTIIQFFGKRY
jgi:hypothetical protein